MYVFLWLNLLMLREKNEIINRCFSDYRPNDRKVLYRILQLRHYKTNEQIYQSGAYTAIYFLAAGSAGLFKEYENNPPERIKYISIGQWFGFSALSAGTSRTESAHALEENTVLLALCITDYEELIKNNPRCALKILQAVCGDLADELSTVRDEYYTLTSKLTHANILV